MQAYVNGETCQLKDGLTVAALIDDLGLTGRRIAIEVNSEIVPRSEHPQYTLQEGDAIEVVQAIGGGDGSSSNKHSMPNIGVRL